MISQRHLRMTLGESPILNFDCLDRPCNDQTIMLRCDFGSFNKPEHWQMMLEVKTSDTGFGHLVDSMLADGWIPSEPIPLNINKMGGGMSISEAHHRLCFAILTCLDEVPVRLIDYDDIRFHDDDMLVTKQFVRKSRISAHGNNEDPYPFCLDL